VVADGQRAAYPDLRDMDFSKDSVGSYQGFDIRGGFFEGGVALAPKGSKAH
jgi:hypothetical protein